MLVAQDASVYVAGGPMFSWQSARTPPNEPDLAQPGIGGSAIGVIGTVGFVLSPHLSIAGEVSVPARFVTTQELHYSFSALYENHHRDVIVSALLHVHGRQTARVRPELVRGGSYVREDTVQLVAYQVGAPFPPTENYGPFSPAPAVIRDTLALTGGADVPIRLTNHVSLVPEGRVHWIARVGDSEAGTASADLVLGPVVVRLAVAVRASF